MSKLKHPIDYEDFIKWTALPKTERKPKTQKELAKKIEIPRRGLWIKLIYKLIFIFLESESESDIEF